MHFCRDVYWNKSAKYCKKWTKWTSKHYTYDFNRNRKFSVLLFLQTKEKHISKHFEVILIIGRKAFWTRVPHPTPNLYRIEKRYVKTFIKKKIGQRFVGAKDSGILHGRIILAQTRKAKIDGLSILKINWVKPIHPCFDPFPSRRHSNCVPK